MVMEKWEYFERRYSESLLLQCNVNDFKSRNSQLLYLLVKIIDDNPLFQKNVVWGNSILEPASNKNLSEK